MPSALFSHQGVVLPLKIRYPKKIDGTSLLFGTFLVDFEYVLKEIFKLLSPNINFPLGHSLLGIFVWVIPSSIFFAIIFSKWIGPFIGNMVKKMERGKGIFTYFGFDRLVLLKNKRYSFPWLWISYYSALIGAFSHLLLDLPSHQYIPWFHPFLLLETLDFMKYEIANYGYLRIGPISWHLNLTIYNLIWLAETLIFGIMCLYFLRTMKKKEYLELWYS